MFGRASDLRTSDDLRINEWLKSKITEATLPQTPVSDGWRPKTMTLNLTAEEIAALEKLADAELPLWQLISALRSDEGDAVTLLCDNPEGPPNNAIECCGMWTAWIDRRFEGETLAAALLAAYRARKALPDPPPLSDKGVSRDGSSPATDGGE